MSNMSMTGKDLESGGEANKNHIGAPGINNNDNINSNINSNSNIVINYISNIFVAPASSSSVHQRLSWLVPMFVLTNCVVFVVLMYINDCPKTNPGVRGQCVARFLGRFSFQPLRENPLFGPSSSTLAKVGALQWDNVVNHRQGWRLITCIWLHAGIVHLATNMLSLVFIGIRLGQQLVRIGIIYLLSGFGGSVLSSLFIRNYISVGASAALFGLLGAMLSELVKTWTIYTSKVAILLTPLVIIVINLAIGILPHLDNFAHIRGFLTGFLLGFIVFLRPQYGWLEQPSLPSGVRRKSKYKAYQYVLWILSLVLLIAGLLIALVMLFWGENGDDHSHWCRYLSCVPISNWKCNES